MEDRVPKYYSVKRELVKRIELGEYPENEPVLSERELMEAYQVSRITVRRAIDELVNEGYLYKIQGKGTYIKGDTSSQDLFSITSCTEDVLRLGKKPSRRVVQARSMTADRKRAKALQITLDDTVFCLGRITYADGEPLNYTRTCLPEKLFPGIGSYNFAEESLYGLLEKRYQARITTARRTIEAVLAQDEIAEYLEVEEGTPLILFGCVTCGIVNGKETPIETFKSYYRTDKFKFCINQVKETSWK